MRLTGKPLPHGWCCCLARHPWDITKDWQALADEAERLGATTVVIDSLKDVLTNPSDETAASGYNKTRQTLLRRGIELIELLAL
jgi:hypothetical protein